MFFERGGVLTVEESDSFEKRLGTTEGDILLYGTLSNLPKLFGGDGASVYTRGDTYVRLPVVNMHIASTAARIYNGVPNGWDALVNSTAALPAQQGRPDERRAGNACVATCRIRWASANSKKI